MSLAAAVEADSEHTIARGIRQSALDRKLSLPAVVNFEAIKGRGIRATQDGREIHVGGPRMWKCSVLSCHLRSTNSRAGPITRDKVSSFSSLMASLLPAWPGGRHPAESQQAVNRLHEMGIQAAMLTGDSQSVAESVAEELGIDRFFAEVCRRIRTRR